MKERLLLMADIDFPWKVDDAYPCSAMTPSGERLYFEDLLTVGQQVGHGDGEGNVFPPLGVVVERQDGLWIEPKKPCGGGVP